MIEILGIKGLQYLTGLKYDLNTAARREQWIRWLQQRDFEARTSEIQNLPSEAVFKLAGEPRQAPNRLLFPMGNTGCREHAPGRSSRHKAGGPRVF